MVSSSSASRRLSSSLLRIDASSLFTSTSSPCSSLSTTSPILRSLGLSQAGSPLRPCGLDWSQNRCLCDDEVNLRTKMRPLVLEVGWLGVRVSYGTKWPSVGIMTRSSSGSSRGTFLGRQQKWIRSAVALACWPYRAKYRRGSCTVFGVEVDVAGRWLRLDLEGFRRLLGTG